MLVCSLPDRLTLALPCSGIDLPESFRLYFLLRHRIALLVLALPHADMPQGRRDVDPVDVNTQHLPHSYTHPLVEVEDSTSTLVEEVLGREGVDDWKSPQVVDLNLRLDSKLPFLKL